MAEISVIMPVYNKEKYIESSVRSVLDQSFADIELIVINDGSTDDSLKIVNNLAKTDSRVRIIDVPNGGVSSARTIGLENAAGNWIQFLDADDTLESDYLENAIQVIKKENADILFSNFTMVDPHKTPIREVHIPECGMRNQRELCDCFIYYQYATGFFGYISNKLFSKKLLNASNARFPVGIKLAEDLDFYAKLYPFVDRAYFWEGKSFLYLQTENNYLNNTVVDYRSQLLIHMDVKRWFEKSGLYETYKHQLDQKINQYIGFIFFHDNEAGKDLREAYKYASENAEIMACINPNLVSGFTKLILRCLQKEDLRTIKRCYAVRNAIRAAYRKFK